MRIRFFLALASVSFAGAALVMQACGGSSESTGTTTDAGNDTGLRDGRPDTGETLDCDPKKDYLKDIPDASIADGASTTGLCVACGRAKCSKEIGACGANCECQDVAAGAIECYTQKQSLLACASTLTGVSEDTQKVGLALFTCLQTECADECVTSQFDPDSGTQDSGSDSGSDSGEDAGADSGGGGN